MSPAVRKLFFFVMILVLVMPGCARAPRRVPAPPVTAAPVGATGFYHTVERGQTLYRIAKSYNVDWHELMALNRISDPSRVETGQKIFIPGMVSRPTAMPVVRGPLSAEEVDRLVGPKTYGSDWRTITLHHSGTIKGGAQAFDRNHRQRHMGGLFYHFVIGNGTNTSDGALEVGWRWKKQVKANRPYDIQICLVGDFNKQLVTESQFSTLVELIQAIREQHPVPMRSIRRHEDIPGKHTACPGSQFPFKRLLNELTTRDASVR